MLKSFRKHYLLVAVLMVTVLLTGCLGKGTKTEEFKLDITVTLDGGEGKVEDVALLVGTKSVTVAKDGKAAATVAEGSVAVKATLDGYVSYDKTHTVSKDEAIVIKLVAVSGEDKELLASVKKNLKDQVALYDILAAGFARVSDENAAGYWIALNEESEPESVKDVQTTIDAVNMWVGVNLANNAMNFVQVLQEGQEHGVVKRVYSELASDYFASYHGIGIAEAYTVIDQIAGLQEDIDTVNLVAARDALKVAMGDLKKVTSDLVLPKTGMYGVSIAWSAQADQNYVNKDGKVTRPAFETAPVTVILTAKLSIVEGEKTIDDIDKEFEVTVLPRDKAIISTYKFDYTPPKVTIADEEIDLEITFKTDVKGDKGYEDVEFAAKIEGPGKVVLAEFVLPEIPDGKLASDDSFDWSLKFTVDKAGAYTVTVSLIDSKTKAVVGALSKTVVLNFEKAYLTRVNEASTIDAMRVALVELALDRDDGFAYAATILQREVAELVLNNKDKDGFEDKSEVVAAIEAQTGARQALINAVNSASNANEMRTALANLEYKPFDDLGAVAQIDATNQFLTEKNKVKDGFVSLEQIKTTLNSVI